MTGPSLAVVGGDERRARVVWSHLVEPVVDPSRSTPGLTVTGLIARDGALRPLEGLASGSLTLAGAQARLAGLDLAAHLRALDRLGIRVLIPGDEEWPLGLDDLRTPPHCLYVRGPFHQSVLHEDGLAVVGARACTPYGSQVARIADGIVDMQSANPLFFKNSKNPYGQYAHDGHDQRGTPTEQKTA